MDPINLVDVPRKVIGLFKDTWADMTGIPVLADRPDNKDSATAHSHGIASLKPGKTYSYQGPRKVRDPEGRSVAPALAKSDKTIMGLTLPELAVGVALAVAGTVLVKEVYTASRAAGAAALRNNSIFSSSVPLAEQAKLVTSSMPATTDFANLTPLQILGLGNV